MKKRFRKAFSLFLAVCVLCAAAAGMAFPRAGAAGGDEAAAVLYLCVSGVRLPYIFGHTWICIENVSGAPLSVGGRELAPGDMMSAGLHTGVGMEFDREMRQFRGNTVTAMRRELTRAAFESAANEIMNGRWDHYLLFTHNCTHFCAAVWRAGTGMSLRASVFPFALKSQMSAGETVGLYIV